jgi:hypothetical protein
MATQFSGGTYVSQSRTCTTKWSLMQFIMQSLSTGTPNAGWTNVALDNGVGTQGPGNVGTCTISIASPGVVNFPSHGWKGGERIVLATTGALPSGLSTATAYYVKFVDANNFNLATSLGGANINTSGSQSGVHTIYSQSIILKSATQANVTNPIAVRVTDNLFGSGSFEVSISNSAFTVNGGNSTGAGGNLLPQGTNSWQIIATQYWFTCFLLSTTGYRKFVMAGMLYVPSFVVGTTDCGFMLCDSSSDSDTTQRNSFRISMDMPGNSANSQVIWNSNLCENAASSGAQSGCVVANYLHGVRRGTPGGWYRWENGDLVSSDVFLSSGLSSVSDESKFKGQFFDMVFAGGPFAADSTDTWSGHNWWNLTHNATEGGVWVATS